MIKLSKALVFFLYFNLCWLFLQNLVVFARVLERDTLDEYLSEVALGSFQEMAIVLAFLVVVKKKIIKGGGIFLVFSVFFAFRAKSELVVFFLTNWTSNMIIPLKVFSIVAFLTSLGIFFVLLTHLFLDYREKGSWKKVFFTPEEEP